MPTYQQVSSIPAIPIKAQQAFDHYKGEMNTRRQNGHSPYSPMYRMKEALISMAILGPGNEDVAKNDELIRLFKDFKTVLGKVLPPSIGFTTISIRMPDVILVTNTGEFLIDASSGGLMSLIDLAWQIFLYSQEKSSFTVTIDEPENHLHPSDAASIDGQPDCGFSGSAIYRRHAQPLYRVIGSGFERLRLALC